MNNFVSCVPHSTEHPIRYITSAGGVPGFIAYTALIVSRVRQRPASGGKDRLRLRGFLLESNLGPQVQQLSKREHAGLRASLIDYVQLHLSDIGTSMPKTSGVPGQVH